MTGTAPLLTTTQMIEAFAAGEITREEAMERLRLSSYSQLLNALADRGIAPPKPPPEQVEAELAGAMPVLRTMEARARSGEPVPAKAGRAGHAGGGHGGEAALVLRIRGMGRAVLLVAGEAPLRSLRAAGRLDLLPGLGMKILVPDGILEAVSDDAAIGTFIEAHSPPFAVERTYAGDIARRRRRAGEPPKTNAADMALADFLTAGGGVERYLRTGDPLLVLCDRIRGLRLFGAPPNLRLLSTAGLLAGLEKAGVIPSADEVLRAMPPSAGR